MSTTTNADDRSRRPKRMTQSIGLVLVGTAALMLGMPAGCDRRDNEVERTAGGNASTQPSSSSSSHRGSHYWYTGGRRTSSSWSSSHRGGSSGSSSSSSAGSGTHSHTSRGGFGSTGHHASS
jgi:hypothetical protein